MFSVQFASNCANNMLILLFKIYIYIFVSDSFQNKETVQSTQLKLRVCFIKATSKYRSIISENTLFTKKEVKLRYISHFSKKQRNI